MFLVREDTSINAELEQLIMYEPLHRMLEIVLGRAIIVGQEDAEVDPFHLSTEETWPQLSKVLEEHHHPKNG